MQHRPSAGTLGVVLWQADPVFRWAVVRYADGPMIYRCVALFTSQAEAHEAIAHLSLMSQSETIFATAAQ